MNEMHDKRKKKTRALLETVLPSDLANIILQMLTTHFDWIFYDRRRKIVKSHEIDVNGWAMTEYFVQNPVAPRLAVIKRVPVGNSRSYVIDSTEFLLPISRLSRLVVCPMKERKQTHWSGDAEVQEIGCIYGFEMEERMEWSTFECAYPLSDFLEHPWTLRLISYKDFKKCPSRVIGILMGNPFEILIYDENSDHSDKPSLDGWADEVAEFWNDHSSSERFLILS